MMNTHNRQEGISITKARSMLPQLSEQLADWGSAIPLTRHGQPIMALMSWDLFESIEETLEIMADSDLMAQLRESIQAVAEGRVRSLEDVAAEMGL